MSSSSSSRSSFSSSKLYRGRYATATAHRHGRCGVRYGGFYRAQHAEQPPRYRDREGGLLGVSYCVSTWLTYNRMVSKLNDFIKDWDSSYSHDVCVTDYPAVEQVVQTAVNTLKAVARKLYADLQAAKTASKVPASGPGPTGPVVELSQVEGARKGGRKGKSKGKKSKRHYKRRKISETY